MKVAVGDIIAEVLSGLLAEVLDIRYGRLVVSDAERFVSSPCRGWRPATDKEKLAYKFGLKTAQPCSDRANENKLLG